MAKSGKKDNKKKSDSVGSPTIQNRKARHDYHIESTLECGIRLIGSEVKAIRDGLVSIGEGYARVDEKTGELWLHDVHIGEYGPARGSMERHSPYRKRKLLAQKREIRKLGIETRSPGTTLVPLRMYFNERGWAKVLVGVARGKQKGDRREASKQRDHQREIDRAMTRKKIG